MKRKIKLIVRAAVFLLIAAALLNIVTLALRRKTYTGAWNYMAKMNEFYALEENSLDYICLGSSHAYCTVNPLEVYHTSSLTGFVLATQEQPLPMSVFYLKEALKTQSPKIVMVEGYMGYEKDEPKPEVLYSALDPMKPSLNKLSAIWENVPRADIFDYVFSISKYHTRWKEVDAEEMISPFEGDHVDTYCGYAPVDRDYKWKNETPDYAAAEVVELPEKNLAALNEMLGICKDSGAEMILLIAPTNCSKMPQISGLAAEIRWAEENGVQVIDLASMTEELGLDGEKDYYDTNHLTVSGAAKTSAYLGDVLSSMDFERAEYDKAEWDAKYENYKKK